MPESKGHLNPGSPGVALARFDVPSELGALVRHVWIARWDISPGEVSRQHILTYPAFNLVITGGGAVLHGPNPRLSVRELSGRSWAVGLLLRPAAGPLLSPITPAELVGGGWPLEGAPIDEVEAAMQDPEPIATLMPLLIRWLGATAARVTDKGLQVNKICRLAEADDEIVRVEELARRAGMSRRNLERLVMHHVGVTPKWLIECRRLQEAASTLYQNPNTDLTSLALSLHYVDYAHFSRRYEEILGETPAQTRARARA